MGSDEATAKTPVLELQGVRAAYRRTDGTSLEAVAGVDLTVRRGEVLGLVGESGSGKSSTARVALGLLPTSAGTIRLLGREIDIDDADDMRRLRQATQIIFQNPRSSLNPRRRVVDTVIEPLRISGTSQDGDERRRRAMDELRAAGIGPELANRRPHELSGGQCQRVAIARATIMRPNLLICDEPVAALDVSIQAQILQLLDELRRNEEMSMLFIAHDLAVVGVLCDRVAVMYMGRICEVLPADQLMQASHPYTRLLLESIPTVAGAADRMVRSKSGQAEKIPSVANPPSGCRFRTRCVNASTKCASEQPPLSPHHADHLLACYHPLTDDALNGAPQ